jgi:hypothetical protein
MWIFMDIHEADQIAKTWGDVLSRCTHSAIPFSMLPCSTARIRLALLVWVDYAEEQKLATDEFRRSVSLCYKSLNRCIPDEFATIVNEDKKPRSQEDDIIHRNFLRRVFRLDEESEFWGFSAELQGGKEEDLNDGSFLRLELP